MIILWGWFAYLRITLPTYLHTRSRQVRNRFQSRIPLGQESNNNNNNNLTPKQTCCIAPPHWFRKPCYVDVVSSTWHACLPTKLHTYIPPYLRCTFVSTLDPNVWLPNPHRCILAAFPRTPWDSIPVPRFQLATGGRETSWRHHEEALSTFLSFLFFFLPPLSFVLV